MPRPKERNCTPDYYTEQHPERAYEMMRDFGMTQKQLARAFGVHEATIKDWRNRYPEFKARMNDGRDEYDCDVIEKCLRRRATGYRYKERYSEAPPPVLDPLTGELKHSDKLKLVRIVTKVLPPDPLACFYWLNNRRKARWKQRQEIGLAVEGSIQILMISPEQADVAPHTEGESDGQ